MDIVFIDTSVFETNNFIEANAINQLLKLGRNKEIQIIIPEIIIREIENRIHKKITESYTVFKNFRREARTLRAIPEHRIKFETINKEESAAFIIKTLHDELDQANAVMIPYPSRNINKIFDSYFTSSPPFGKANKKNEFPDAFSLLAVEEWCEDKTKVCHILSTDKDMTQYRSKYFRSYDNYYDFIDKKLQEIEIREYNNKRIEKAKQLYKESHEEIDALVERWLNEQLENEDNYDLNIYSDIHSIELNEVGFEISDFRFIEISGDNILMESEIAISYKVTLEVDDESTGYYDSDDRSWHYFDTTSVTFESNESIPINFYVETPQAGEEFMTIRIDSINNGYDLEI